MLNRSRSPEVRLDSSPVVVMQHLFGRAGVEERWAVQKPLTNLLSVFPIAFHLLHYPEFHGKGVCVLFFHNCWFSCKTNEQKKQPDRQRESKNVFRVRCVHVYVCLHLCIFSSLPPRVHITTKILSLQMAKKSNKNVALCIQILIFFFLIKFFYISKQE